MVELVRGLRGEVALELHIPVEVGAPRRVEVAEHVLAHPARGEAQLAQAGRAQREAREEPEVLDAELLRAAREEGVVEVDSVVRDEEVGVVLHDEAAEGLQHARLGVARVDADARDRGDAAERDEVPRERARAREDEGDLDDGGRLGVEARRLDVVVERDVRRVEGALGDRAEVAHARAQLVVARDARRRARVGRAVPPAGRHVGLVEEARTGSTNALRGPQPRRRGRRRRRGPRRPRCAATPARARGAPPAARAPPAAAAAPPPLPLGRRGAAAAASRSRAAARRRGRRQAARHAPTEG